MVATSPKYHLISVKLVQHLYVSKTDINSSIVSIIRNTYKNMEKVDVGQCNVAKIATHGQSS